MWGGKKAGEETVEMSPEARAKLQRKCQMFIVALDACRKTNVGDDAACKNLEMRVITCYGENAAKPEADEHRRCYTSIYKTGMYKGSGHCTSHENALKEALRKQKLFPV
ncbi:MAG: hypothetical protein WDW36_005201 [Sanguina aurantia]